MKKGRKSTDIIVRLNDGWAVAADSRQWMLCRTDKTGRTPVKFFTRKGRLLGRISAMCGEVDPDALKTIVLWDEFFAIWAMRRGHATPGFHELLKPRKPRRPPPPRKRNIA